MNVAIAGAGIAGSYLARLLREKGIMADLFDGIEHENQLPVQVLRVGSPCQDRELPCHGRT